jgi:hypothetical protein
MTKSVKANKPATPAVTVTPPNTSKRAVARLKVREAKHGSIEPRSKQKWVVGLIGKGWLK